MVPLGPDKTRFTTQGSPSPTSIVTNTPDPAGIDAPPKANDNAVSPDAKTLKPESAASPPLTSNNSAPVTSN